MNTVRYFKSVAKRQLIFRQDAGDDSSTLQQVQHQVAVDAGYTSWDALRTASDTDRRLAVAMTQEPSLTWEGFGAGYFKATPQERRTAFIDARIELRGNADRIEQIRAWLEANITPRKTIDPAAGSYSLKDLAERDLGWYLSNGEFIAAAIIAGYPYRAEFESPNARFGMSARSVSVVRARNRF